MVTLIRRCVFFAIALAGLLVATGCNKQPAPPPAAKPAAEPLRSVEKNSFAAVTAKLDPGGDLYAYLDTEPWLAGVSDRIAATRSLLESVPSIKPEDRENLNKALCLVTNLVRQSGLEEISGVGISSIALETNLYHAKLFLHHYPGQGSGLAWKLFGQSAHTLVSLDWLPATTALAAFTDLDAPLAWAWLKTQVAQANLAEAQAALDRVPQSFEHATDLKWNQVLESLGGEFGIVITLDDSKVITLPSSNNQNPLQIPEPALVLIARVKNDVVFNRIHEALNQYGGTQIIRTDKPGLKMRTWPLPIPLPIPARPTVAAAEGYLLISTTDSVLEEMLAVKSGKHPGLKATDEFKRLAQHVPAAGNGFSFISRRFGEAMSKVQEQALQMTGNSSEAQTALVKSLFGSGAPFTTYAVAANIEEGWMGVANGNQHPAKFLSAAAVVPAGVIAAIAIPNFVKARNSAQQNACINNLRQLDAAKQQWALENRKPATETPTENDLKPFLKGMPSCPAGGTYTLHQLSEAPTCDHVGHKLPN